MSNMISKQELESMGFKTNQAITIIRQAKIKMVNKGFPYYNNKRIGVVPRFIVEDIIGISLSKEE
ncbi:DUF3173 family protein [Leuconostoc pseudomesenteroides]|uniref:DUF3173 family protein n=1 Tax=Leuconostoc pseudomesenteroides TaxID=33968 RepID=UPI00301C96D2